MLMKKTIWASWIFVSLIFTTYFGNMMFISDDKSVFLIGEASHGHFQIEMACETCHSDAFGGRDALQDACVKCHAEELEMAHDTHPLKKFKDPRESYRIKILDARYCISCHAEHQKEKTHTMGVTLPDDYCFHCHKETLKERKSHRDLDFDSCASAGCHNFHDNRALYESFLVENSGQPWLKEIAKIASTNATDRLKKPAITISQSRYQEKIASHPVISQQWQDSSHANAGVDCGGCHSPGSSVDWLPQPTIKQCQSCHEDETKGFTQGKHGMRLAENISKKLIPIKPSESKLSFRTQSLQKTHGCNACHKSHEFNPQKAAVGSCLSCHADDHSIAFNDSPHGILWQEERAGSIPPGSGVSCATCHMPRTIEQKKEMQMVFVEHNQNLNLRPNEKMIRSVCMSCHGLEFSIDALADNILIKNNFNGKPGTHIESVNWAAKRAKRPKKK